MIVQARYKKYNLYSKSVYPTQVLTSYFNFRSYLPVITSLPANVDVLSLEHRVSYCVLKTNSLFRRLTRQSRVSIVQDAICG